MYQQIGLVECSRLKYVFWFCFSGLDVFYSQGIA